MLKGEQNIIKGFHKWEALYKTFYHWKRMWVRDLWLSVPCTQMTSHPFLKTFMWKFHILQCSPRLAFYPRIPSYHLLKSFSFYMDLLDWVMAKSFSDVWWDYITASPTGTTDLTGHFRDWLYHSGLLVFWSASSSKTNSLENWIISDQQGNLNPFQVS